MKNVQISCWVFCFCFFLSWGGAFLALLTCHCVYKLAYLFNMGRFDGIMCSMPKVQLQWNFVRTKRLVSDSIDMEQPPRRTLCLKCGWMRHEKLTNIFYSETEEKDLHHYCLPKIMPVRNIRELARRPRIIFEIGWASRRSVDRWPVEDHGGHVPVHMSSALVLFNGC